MTTDLMTFRQETAMTDNLEFKKLLVLGLVVAGFIVLSADLTPVHAQRDPFELPAWKKPKTPAGAVGKDGKPVPQAAQVSVAPVEARIAHFKRQREEAAASGTPMPKVTSVMTLDELAVTGIFKTPRGYAAMVEVKPIKLSYAVYPGDRFFDGQLVAIEENKLVFRKVTKMSNGKFVTSVETKPLRQYTQEQEVQGTAPAGSETASTGSESAPSAAPVTVISPLEEMNRQKPGSGDGSRPAGRKSSRTSTKIAGVRR